MARGYRLVVSVPKTKKTAAERWEFTQDTGNVLSIDVELRKDKTRTSVCNAKLIDKKWEIFNQIPDPAFAAIGVEVFQAKPADPSKVIQRIFMGQLTSLQVGFPEPESLIFVAEDLTIQARINYKHHTFQNMKSTKIARTIARQYGFEVETTENNLVIKNRKIEIGTDVSDWDFMCRVLAGDGLRPFVKGKKLYIRQIDSTPYPTVFKRGEPPVVRLEASINIYKELPNVKTTTPLDGDPTKPAVQNAADKAEADATNQTVSWVKRLIIGVDVDAAGAHAEDQKAPGYKNKVTEKRYHKDSARLTITALPDLFLYHSIVLRGWGGKIDGNWQVESIRYPVTGSEYPVQELSLRRAPSDAAKKAVGIAPLS